MNNQTTPAPTSFLDSINWWPRDLEPASFLLLILLLSLLALLLICLVWMTYEYMTSMLSASSYSDAARSEEEEECVNVPKDLPEHVQRSAEIKLDTSETKMNDSPNSDNAEIPITLETAAKTAQNSEREVFDQKRNLTQLSS
jgi:hypothetical protein